MSHGPDDTSLIKQLTPANMPKPTLDDVFYGKKAIKERYSEEDQMRLKELADLLRRPMNRKQRRALQARLRQAA